ncbi:transglycosylase SLT domain-containing protein [Peribacillus castrilensis]|uniref:transglycosylase SLT domain-containing protein n=1 Tax=Peribacillus castrilensis TaxID=2897690 RepID=UPI003D2C4E19
MAKGSGQSMSLRDLTVDIDLSADSSPIQDLNKHMNNFTKNVQGTSSDVNKMGKTFTSSYQSMIQESQAFNKNVNRQSNLISQLARTSGMSATHLAQDWSSMTDEMRKSMITNHNSMQKHRKDLMGVTYDMRKLGMQMGHYTGTTDDFMGEIHKLGKTHKKISDQMINSNLSMRQGLIQSVATMSAMSGQSEKISAGYDRMNKSIFKVNKPLLAVTSNLERMAREGSAAQVALQMLGPNASMKALQDQIAMITQGIMRQQMVLMAAGIAWLGFTAILAHAAMGPDPAKIRGEQAELTKIYKAEWQKRIDEISHFVGIFEKVSVPKVKTSDVMKAMKSQLKAVQTYSSSIQSLTAKGVDNGLIKELQKAGPAAAYQIKALDSMSKTELNKYVATWREKMSLATTQATSELSKLKRQTDAKIKDLQDSLKPLGVSWEKFKGTWSTALAPFVELWGQLAAGFVKVGTKVGEFANRLNEISPWITKLAGMFLYLVVTFTMILAPLAAGIGYFYGLKVAFTAAWTLIGPLVTGLGAMMGTVLLVSAVVIGLGAALYLLWTRSETFRNGVISSWNAIKSAAVSVYGFIRPYIMQAISIVVTFVQQKMSQLRTFWEQNGAMILQAGKNVWSFLVTVIGGALKGIWAVMKFIWPAVLLLIKSVWANIRGVIDGALMIIMGLVKVFSGLFTGNFGKMWEGIKQIFFGAIKLVWNYINLMMFGRILSAGKIFFSGFKTIISTLWSTLKNLFLNGIKAVKGFVTTGFKSMHSSIGNIMKLIRDTVTTRFTNIIDAAKALPGKIGSGIKSMGHKALDGIKSFGKTIFGGFKKIINGATGGLNWAMGKLGIDFTIPDWKPPEYAKGTNFHPGGPAVIGEKGRELVHANGQTFLANKKMMLNLPRGASVLTNSKTEKLLSAGVPGYAKGIGDAFNKAKNTAGNAWAGAKNVAGNVKDKALDVFSYLSNAKGLATKLFDKFGVSFPKISGAFNEFGGGSVKFLKNKATDFLKKKMKDFASIGNFAGGSFKGGAAAPNQVKGWVTQALNMTNTPLSWLPAMLVKAQKESGYNPRAINLWDINAKRGIPSKGLFQTIDPTFNAYKMAGMNDIYNPIHNAVAAIRYIKSRYGTVFNTPGIKSMAHGGRYKGYATGTNGPLKKSEWAWVGEQGPELMRLNKGTEVFNHNDSKNIASGSYNPTNGVTSASTGQTYIDYKPTVHVTVQGGASDGNIDHIVKDAVEKALEEHYHKLLSLFKSGVIV